MVTPPKLPFSAVRLSHERNAYSRASDLRLERSSVIDTLPTGHVLWSVVRRICCAFSLSRKGFMIFTLAQRHSFNEYDILWENRQIGASSFRVRQREQMRRTKSYAL